MSWTLIEETPAPMMRWQARLTQDSPDPGSQSMALIVNPVVQIEGTFGAAAITLMGSNSARDYVPWDSRHHPDLIAVLPTLFLKVVAEDADETTDVLVTLVGRR